MSVAIVTFANIGKKPNLKTSDIEPVVARFAKTGELAQCICQVAEGSPYAHTIPAIPSFIRYPLRSFERLSGISISRRRMEMLFDWFASRRIRPAEIVLFHGGAVMPRTLRKARAQGAVCVDIAVSAHVSANAVLEKEELQRAGYGSFHGLYQRIVSETLEKNATRFDYTIVMSDFAKKTYEDAGISSNTVFIAQPDIAIPEYTPSEIQRTPWKLLYMAHTQPIKGLSYLLDAWESLRLPKDERTVAELSIVGGFSDMPPALRESFEERMRTIPGVRYYGNTSNPQMFYAQSSAFVSPSLTEGFGRVTLEAMAVGLPVITTEHARGIVEDGTTGFVVPIRDSQALAEKIRYLYDHRERAQEMGRAGREAVEQKKPFATEVYEIYQRILEREHLT